MEIRAENPVDAFIQLTDALVFHHQLYGVLVRFPFLANFFPSCEEVRFGDIFDETFAGKTAWREGKEWTWREWLGKTGFNMEWYLENDCDLRKLAQDKRMSNPQYSGKGKMTTDVGWLTRPLGDSNNLLYLLDRWRNPKFRSQPQYYFCTVPTDWYYEDLKKHQNMPKTGRTAAACCSNMYFRWNKLKEMPIAGWIMKHCNWSHMYEDIFCPEWLGKALCEYFDFKYGEINVFFVSITLDDKKRAMEILEKWVSKEEK